MIAKVIFKSIFELAGLLGAVIILTGMLHFVVNAAAFDGVLPVHLNPVFGLVSEVLRVVAQNSLDSGSIWLSASIFGLVFVGAAMDYALGNFAQHLAAAVGVRLDAIEALNPDWDLSVSNAGKLGSVGGNPPAMNVSNAGQQLPVASSASAAAFRAQTMEDMQNAVRGGNRRVKMGAKG